MFSNLAILGALARFFEVALSSSIILLEPMLVVAISLVIVGVVVALFMPMVGVLEHLFSY